MTRPASLDELLRAEEGDAGCDAGVPIMDQYVEIELRGEDPSERFPGTAIHWRVPGLSGGSRRRARGRAPVRRHRGGVTAHLLSVNVGGPRQVAWEGKTVRSAIWKESVEGPRMVRRMNIDGDDQADRVAHGGEHRAVFVYQSAPTVTGNASSDATTSPTASSARTSPSTGCDDEVHIGDRYRIGEALFEVTQPRVTCYRVGIRMNEPAMPTLLVAHHRPGFYFRVLEEGFVQAGDEIEKVLDGPEGLTVADIDGLLYLPNKSRALLERALLVPALSTGWQESFRELLAKADRDAPTAPAWAGFQPLRVAEIRRESSTITSFLLVPTGDEVATPVAAPGQYLTVRVRPDMDQQPLTRSYSLSNVADEHGYRISVKREGAGSRYLDERVSVGDVLEVAAPRGNFVLRAGTRPVVLISAGVGATPVLAMLHALAREQSTRPVWWIHGARNHSEQAFGAEVDELLATLPDSHRLVAFSQPSEADTPGADYDVTGRVDLTVLEQARVPNDADCYVCGPDGFMRAIGAMLVARGVAPERIATEIFGAIASHRSGIVKTGDRGPHAPDGRTGTGPIVTFSRSNLAVPWTIGTRACWTSPKAAMCRSTSAAVTEPATRAKAGFWPARSPITLNRWNRRRTAEILVCSTRPSSELTLDL